MSDLITRYELGRTRFLVGSNGGDINAVDAAGEVHWTIGLMPGVHESKEYHEYLQPGWSIQCDRGVTAMVDQRRRAKANPSASNSRDSGANPDFKPTLATAGELRLRAIEKQMRVQASRAERMLAQAKLLADAKPEPKPEPKEEPPAPAPKKEPVAEAEPEVKTEGAEGE